MMHNFPFIWKSKFGITDDEKARERCVDESTDGAVFYIFPPAQIPFGWQAEGFVHALYFWANNPFEEGSGRSEWFTNINPIVGGAALYASYRFGFWVDWWWYALLLLSPVIWLDGLFWLLFFLVFWWLVGIAGVVMMWHYWIT